MDRTPRRGTEPAGAPADTGEAGGQAAAPR